MIVGFTGTRKGMTRAQRYTIQFMFSSSKRAKSAIHGDCMGADNDFHNIVMKAGLDVTLRPCNLSEQRAYCEGARVIHEPEDPISRNHKIVDESNLMIACPSSRIEKIRSGTWATIRYAKRTGKKLAIVWPSGEVEWI